MTPEHFETARRQWEYSHAASAVLTFLALIAIASAVSVDAGPAATAIKRAASDSRTSARRCTPPGDDYQRVAAIDFAGKRRRQTPAINSCKS